MEWRTHWFDSWIEYELDDTFLRWAEEQAKWIEQLSDGDAAFYRNLLEDLEFDKEEDFCRTEELEKRFGRTQDEEHRLYMKIVKILYRNK